MASDVDLEEDVIEKDVYSILEVLSSKIINSSGNIFQEAFDRTLDLFLLVSLSSNSTTAPNLTKNNTGLTPNRHSFNVPPAPSLLSSSVDKRSSFREAVIHLLRSAFEDIERCFSNDSLGKLVTSQSSFRGEIHRSLLFTLFFNVIL